MGDNQMETMRGRIYRIAPSGHKIVAPKVDLKTPEGRIAALCSPNAATRNLAWTAIHELGPKAEKELLGLWKKPGKDPLVARHRARALHLLARLEGAGPKYLAEAMVDPNPDIRLTAVRVARSVKMDVIPVIEKLAADPAAEVRRECAIALRKNPSPRAAELWAALAARHDGKDRWYVEALGIGAQGHESEAFDAWLAKVGEKWNTPAGRDVIWRSRAPKAAGYLVKIILDPATPEADKPRYIRSLDFIDGPEKEAALIEMLGAGK
jgi:HEAT repeat protein